jgi:hypothetical protein
MIDLDYPLCIKAYLQNGFIGVGPLKELEEYARQRERFSCLEALSSSKR